MKFMLKNLNIILTKYIIMRCNQCLEQECQMTDLAYLNYMVRRHRLRMQNRFWGSVRKSMCCRYDF